MFFPLKNTKIKKILLFGVIFVFLGGYFNFYFFNYARFSDITKNSILAKPTNNGDFFQLLALLPDFKPMASKLRQTPSFGLVFRK